MDMSDRIFDVLIPTEKKIKITNGKRKTVIEKLFPGYIFVEMTVTDDSWYVVRNTPHVTGFIGAGTTPSPVDIDEMLSLQRRVGQEEPKYNMDLEVNLPVFITDGPFKGFEGKISEIDEDRGKVKVLVSMFGRETPVELDFLQIKKV
jgi:transcriptional antiterminator NusG